MNVLIAGLVWAAVFALLQAGLVAREVVGIASLLGVGYCCGLLHASVIMRRGRRNG